MPEQAPELIELRKQTRLLAKKEADKAAGAGCGIGFALGALLLFAFPNWVTIALMALLPIGGAITFYRWTMRRWTSDKISN